MYPPNSGLLAAEGRIGVLFVANSLYGAYLVLFTLSSLVLHRQVLLNRKQSSGSFGTIIHLTLGYILFLSISSSWVFLWIIYMHPNLGKGQFSISFYIQVVLGSFATLVAQYIILYRLYIILDRKEIVMKIGVFVPLVQAGRTFKLAFSIYDFVYFAKHRVTWDLGSIFLVTSALVTDVVATALMSWKIWYVNRVLGGQKVLKKVLSILIESAALYTAWMTSYLILFLVDRGASHVLLFGSPAVAGIATSLVNVRVGLGWAAGEEGRSTLSLHDSAFTQTDIGSGGVI